MRKYTRAPASRATGGLSAAYLEAADEEGEEEEEYEEEAGVSASERARRDLSRPRHDPAAEVRLGPYKGSHQTTSDVPSGCSTCSRLSGPPPPQRRRRGEMLCHVVPPTCLWHRAVLQSPQPAVWPAPATRAGRIAQTVLAYLPLDVSSGAAPAACCPARVRHLT